MAHMAVTVTIDLAVNKNFHGCELHLLIHFLQAFGVEGISSLKRNLLNILGSYCLKSAEISCPTHILLQPISGSLFFLKTLILVT